MKFPFFKKCPEKTYTVHEFVGEGSNADKAGEVYLTKEAALKVAQSYLETTAAKKGGKVVELKTKALVYAAFVIVDVPNSGNHAQIVASATVSANP